MRKKIDPALQYSKYLSKVITWFWIVYRAVVAIISGIVPDAAGSLAGTIGGVDTIMMINVGTYMVNSIGEKYIYSDRFVLQWIKSGGWKSFASKLANSGVSCGDDDIALDEGEEEGGNG